MTTDFAFIDETPLDLNRERTAFLMVVDLVEVARQHQLTLPADSALRAIGAIARDLIGDYPAGGGALVAG